MTWCICLTLNVHVHFHFFEQQKFLFGALEMFFFSPLSVDTVLLKWKRLPSLLKIPLLPSAHLLWHISHGQHSLPIQAASSVFFLLRPVHEAGVVTLLYWMWHSLLLCVCACHFVRDYSLLVLSCGIKDGGKSASIVAESPPESIPTENPSRFAKLFGKK